MKLNLLLFDIEIILNLVMENKIPNCDDFTSLVQLPEEIQVSEACHNTFSMKNRFIVFLR